jgi:hypothetical protein
LLILNLASHFPKHTWEIRRMLQGFGLRGSKGFWVTERGVFHRNFRVGDLDDPPSHIHVKLSAPESPCLVPQCTNSDPEIPVEARFRISKHTWEIRRMLQGFGLRGSKGFWVTERGVFE